MSTATKERPIIFSGPMVQAILEGRKTQTRRVVKHAGDFLGGGGKANREEWDDPNRWGWEDPENPSHFIVLGRNPEQGDVPVRCPYGVPGDRLWVREAHWRNGYVSRWCGSEPDEPEWVTNQPIVGQERALRNLYVRFTDPGDPNHWWKRPGMFLPRWACRLDLEITGVRVERLQEISIEDVLAEGIPAVEDGPHANQYWREETGAKFVSSWDRINGKRHPWSANPWVWVVEFRRLKGGAA
jgi:hypothetical protein